jgi:DNA adenine methylase
MLETCQDKAVAEDPRDLVHHQKPRPFLRWAGGKQKLVRHLLRYTPPPKVFVKYYESMVGGGSLFFAISPPDAVLSDINAELMNCYSQVAADVEGVLGCLDGFASRHSAQFYYRVRDRLSAVPDPCERAALFIYLNKAAFNGIYRVNLAGRFNVPFGPSARGLALPTSEELRAASRVLQSTLLLACDFEVTLKDAGEGDFVYLDPPYPPLNRTSCFVHYSPARFTWLDQERVARVFSELTKRGCLVMVSNSDQDRVRELYRGSHMHELKTRRWIRADGARVEVSELVITNYEPRTVE